MTLFEVLGDFLVGLFGSVQNLVIVPFALAVYAIANVFWLISLKKGSGLARGSVLFGVITLVITATVAIALFNESPSPQLIAGMLIGIVSMYMLSD